MCVKARQWTIWAAALLLACTSGFAQDEPPADPLPEAAAEVDLVPDDLLDRGTPRRAARGFLMAVSEGDYERAAEYLDLRNLPRGMSEADGPTLAEDLDIVLQRHLWIDQQELSDEIDGWAGDGLPSYRDRLGVLQTRGGEVTLLLQQIPREDGVPIWKISNNTVARIPAFYDELGYSRLVENFRRSFPDGRFLGIEYFKWALALAAGLIVYGLCWLLAVTAIRFLTRPDSTRGQLVRRFLTGPAIAMAAILTVNAVGTNLGVGFGAQALTRVRPVSALILLWFLLASVALARDLYAQRLKDEGREGRTVLLGPISTTVQLIIAVVVLLMWLDNAGFEIGTLLAGLGVGGLAVALVLQRPLEDVFGAATLYSQQPVRIGDFCRVGEFVGTIEEISLRTTRLRTLDNTVVAIPNAKIATAEIDNISMRRKIWYHPVLKLRYDSTPEQIQEVLDKTRELLNGHDKVMEDANVRLTGVGDYAVEVGVRAYIATTTFDEFLAIAEELNLAIMNIVAGSGATFSSPVDWQATA
jgi:MscS family membrane protein